MSLTDNNPAYNVLTTESVPNAPHLFHLNTKYKDKESSRM